VLHEHRGHVRGIFRAGNGDNDDAHARGIRQHLQAHSLQRLSHGQPVVLASMGVFGGLTVHVFLVCERVHRNAAQSFTC
jgi:hypothetical protein